MIFQYFPTIIQHHNLVLARKRKKKIIFIFHVPRCVHKLFFVYAVAVSFILLSSGTYKKCFAQLMLVPRLAHKTHLKLHRCRFDFMNYLHFFLFLCPYFWFIMSRLVHKDESELITMATYGCNLNFLEILIHKDEKQKIWQKEIFFIIILSGMLVNSPGDV